MPSTDLTPRTITTGEAIAFLPHAPGCQRRLAADRRTRMGPKCCEPSPLPRDFSTKCQKLFWRSAASRVGTRLQASDALGELFSTGLPGSLRVNLKADSGIVLAAVTAHPRFPRRTLYGRNNGRSTAARHRAVRFPVLPWRRRAGHARARTRSGGCRCLFRLSQSTGVSRCCAGGA